MDVQVFFFIQGLQFSTTFIFGVYRIFLVFAGVWELFHIPPTTLVGKYVCSGDWRLPENAGASRKVLEVVKITLYLIGKKSRQKNVAKPG